MCQIIISLTAASALFIAFDNPLQIVKGYIFAQILFFTAFHDVRTREIPNIVHILIIFTALIFINPINSIIGLLIVPLPFFIATIIKENSIGGGDIKLIGACGFMLGCSAGIFASIISLIVAVSFNFFKKNGFALAPYLAVGCFTTYLIF